MTMKAAFIETFGPPEKIQFGDVPTPSVGQRDVLVQVAAVTVDPIDTYIRSGAFDAHAPLPFVIGRDMAGQVVETGSEVTQFHPGDWVWANNQGYAGRQGTFSEYCRVEEDLLYRLPEGVDPADAAIVVHSGLTAVLGLQFKANLQKGETLFINGGGGNVGTAVLTIAKALGARVAVTAGSDEKAQWCKELGADRIILYKKEDVASSLREFAPNGVNVYWDATPKPDAQRAVDAIAQRGRIILMAGGSHETVLPSGKFYLGNCTMYGFTVTDARVEELSLYAGEINRWLGRGVLRAKVARRLPLSEAAEAHRLVEVGGLFGKILLQP